MAISIPRLYPILDASVFPTTDRVRFLQQVGSSLADAGVTLLEYRNKRDSDEQILADASVLRQGMPAGEIRLILDDRVDLVDSVGFDGVHVDAGDVSPAEARAILGPSRIVGTYGGTEVLIENILHVPADYLSIGPVYPTRTKRTTKCPIGPSGVRKLRAEAGDSTLLVAVGGITLETVAEVLAAGADTVAVSAAFFCHPDPGAEFRRWMLALGI